MSKANKIHKKEMINKNNFRELLEINLKMESVKIEPKVRRAPWTMDHCKYTVYDCI